jgi:hypothetical protein
MKKLLLLCVSLFLVLSAAGFALDFSADVSFKTGDNSLDLHFSNVNKMSKTPAGAIEVRRDLRENLLLSDKQITFLSRKGYTLAEISYIALLARKTNMNINDIVVLQKSKGVGWGLLAKRLGVRPSDLNKLRVREKKREKAAARERIEIKVKTGRGKAK